VRARRRGSQVALQVADSGIGLTREHRDLVFEEFFQVDNPERDRAKGTGLGLSIAQRAAVLMGSRIGVRSRLGRGSIFGLSLPFAGEAPASAATAYAQAPLIAGLFVVVVEDEAEIRSTLRDLLESWGCVVVDGASADEVLARLNETLRTPDLLLCDYRLADGHTGLQAIARLRQNQGEHVPALLVTGDTTEKFDGLRPADKIQVVNKPLSIQRLRSAIVEVVRAA